MGQERTIPIDVPARMNTDLSASEIDKDEAVDIFNFLIHEPGQLRRRKPSVFKCSFPGTGYNQTTTWTSPIGVVTASAAATGATTTALRSRALVTFMNYGNAGNIGGLPYRRQNPGSSTTYGNPNFVLATTSNGPMTWDTGVNSGPASAARYWAYFVNADSATAWTVTMTNNNGTATGYETNTQSDNYFGSAYYASADVIYASFYPVASALATKGVTGTRLMKWGGAAPNALAFPLLNYYATLTNGATVGTLYASPGTVTAGVASVTQTLTSVTGITVGQTVLFYDPTLTTLRGTSTVSSINTGAHQITMPGSITTTTNDICLVASVDAFSGYYIGFQADLNYPYTYQLSANASAPGSFTIERPYGLGQPAGNVPNKTLAKCIVRDLQVVYTSPPDVQCVHMYQNRLFVGRPTLGAALPLSSGGTLPVGQYPTAMGWCQAGSPEIWPASNWLLIDPDPSESLMGFATLGNQLGIFTRNAIYTMSGTDESNYSVNLFTNEMGCLDSRSITPYRTGCIFMSDKGLFYFDGSQLRDLTQSRAGHGIRTVYRDRSQFFSLTDFDAVQATSIIPGTDYAMMSGNRSDRAIYSPLEDSYNYAMFLPGPNAQTISYYYIPNGSWMRVGNDWSPTTYSNSYWLYTKPGEHINNKCVAFTRHAAYELDNMFAQEASSGDITDQTLTNTGFESILTGNAYTTAVAVGATWSFVEYVPPLGYDWCVTSNNGVIVRGQIPIPVRLQYRDTILGPETTSRFNDIRVSNNVWYVRGAGSNSPNVQGLNVALGWDNNIDTLTQMQPVQSVGAATPSTGAYNMVQPRYEGATFSTAFFNHVYTSVVEGSYNWEFEAKAVRIALDNTYMGAQTNPSHSMKLYGISMRIIDEMPMRIDNPVV